MYNIFLAGPWERYSSQPYKSLFRASFPTLSFYDPEEHQVGGLWFEKNLDALRRCDILVVFIPSFPFPGVGPEVGVYFEHRTMMGRRPKIVAIWPDEIGPQWGKEVLAMMGSIVPTVHEAIGVVAGFLEGSHDTPSDSGRVRVPRRCDS